MRLDGMERNTGDHADIVILYLFKVVFPDERS